MNGLMVFSSPEFGQVRTIQKGGGPWFVAADVCKALELGDTGKAVGRLDEDELTRIKIVSGGQNREMFAVNEPGLYSLVLGSRKPEARAFKRWITHEVIPSIRKTGGYTVPQDYISALRALADSEEKRQALVAENETQRQAIADFEPIKQYVDAILASTGTMATSQIAADYDISAKKLNKILHEEGIQHNVNGQWILYQRHMGKGYTKSETIPIVHSDGRPGTKIYTKWTQKGRILIHEILSNRGILAVMDRMAA